MDPAELGDAFARGSPLRGRGRRRGVWELRGQQIARAGRDDGLDEAGRSSGRAGRGEAEEESTGEPAAGVRVVPGPEGRRRGRRGREGEEDEAEGLVGEGEQRRGRRGVAVVRARERAGSGVFRARLFDAETGRPGREHAVRGESGAVRGGGSRRAPPGRGSAVRGATAVLVLAVPAADLARDGLRQARDARGPGGQVGARGGAGLRRACVRNRVASRVRRRPSRRQAIEHSRRRRGPPRPHRLRPRRQARAAQRPRRLLRLARLRRARDPSERRRLRQARRLVGPRLRRLRHRAPRPLPLRRGLDAAPLREHPPRRPARARRRPRRRAPRQEPRHQARRHHLAHLALAQETQRRPRRRLRAQR
mmetsp:Transcript_22715/g.71115  ORF Transcript_22715/g.71115 Transcript_22715/m.71115 type:complete len:364 (+) Transcript_22715:234-1325(+)